MKTIVLIPCAKKKDEQTIDKEVPAQELYISIYFKLALTYAEKLNPDHIFILSDEYYLLELTDRVRFYEKKLANKKQWSQTVMDQLIEKGCDLETDEFVFLTGKSYYEYMDKIVNKKIPLEGLRIGESLKWLKERI